VIAAFVIDCDGTLVDTEPLWDRAKQEVTERWGGRWSAALSESLGGVALGATSRRIVEVAGPPATEGDIARDLLDAFWARLTAAPLLPLAGARQLLEELAKRGILVAVASNGERIHVETALQRAGLRAMIASLHCPEGSLRPKPEPDLYLAACRHLGVAPTQAIAIEDAPPGLQAAHRAGLLTLAAPTARGAAELDVDGELAALWPLDLDALEGELERRAALSRLPG
jgi:HAD superfamily hydrolase (TIGR01509 family)